MGKEARQLLLFLSAFLSRAVRTGWFAVLSAPLAPERGEEMIKMADQGESNSW